MTRDAFLQTLRRGLAGLPPAEIEDILADYAAHFEESRSDGRNADDVAAALGDPARIARELRAESGLRRLESQWSLPNMAAATMALAGLAMVDIFFLAPLLIAAIAMAFGLSVGLVVVGLVGIKIILTTVLFGLGGPVTGAVARLLIGAGMISGAVGGAALLLLVASAGIRTLGRYARLHFRLVQQENVSA